jgi:hypothetical protein
MGTVPRLVAATLAGLLRTALALLVLVGGARAAPDEGATAPGAPVRHRVGLYLTDLHSIDLPRGTFGASFWIWSVGPAAPRSLQTMEFVNANQVAVSLESSVQRGVVGWSQRKVTGVFREQWDLRNFPFDRHVLEILLEEGAEEEARFAYEPDTANSGVGLQDPVEGWRVRDMGIGVGTAAYASSFGDPEAAEPYSRFSRLRVALALERSDYTGFFKLTAALYAGFLICVIGCLVHVTAATFSARITLLAAALFAIVINMRAASLAIGSEHGATLMDKLHMVGLAYVSAVTAATVLVCARVERGMGTERLMRIDQRCCLSAAAVFVVLNAALLVQAAVEG